MEENGVNILTDLAKLSPLIAILVAIIAYLIWKIEKREKEIISLNGYIRDNDRENLQILSNLNNTLDKVIEKQKHSNESVIKEIDGLKEYISLKIKD